jgi:hypothetical protein
MSSRLNFVFCSSTIPISRLTAGMTERCPAPKPLKCSRCYINAIGRCDHCSVTFDRSCFQNHAQNCPGARNITQGTLRLIPQCQFCFSDAVGKCSGCGQAVCSSCFDHSHRVHRIYQTESDSTKCIISWFSTFILLFSIKISRLTNENVQWLTGLILFSSLSTKNIIWQSRISTLFLFFVMFYLIYV